MTETPLYVADTHYVYNLMHSVLLEHYIGHIISHSYIRLTYQVQLDNEPSPRFFEVGDTIPFTDDNGMIRPDLFRKIWLTLEARSGSGFSQSVTIINKNSNYLL